MPSRAALTEAETPSAFLERAYLELDLRGDSLLTPGAGPVGIDGLGDRWTALGDWLMLAHRMGADRVFFVEDDPVVLFVSLSEADDEILIRKYREAWCLSRAQCLFVALPGELRVYSLGNAPPATSEEWREIEPIEVVRHAADVADKLSAFHREHLESGETFSDESFAAQRVRVGPQLLEDVRWASRRLVEAGLEREVAHALIERALLVRYLEDRGVVTTGYYGKVVQANKSWRDRLSKPLGRPVLNSAGAGLISALGDKDLTYAVFSQLSHDFNGELFSAVPGEVDSVRQGHLDLLQQLLVGDTSDGQVRLFFWAYDFSIVPSHLISSMYEEFYRSADQADEKDGVHYTPPELVEFVLAEILTPDMLSRAPRVLDPACGSGIFLVEAFRRMARDMSRRLGRRLTAAELRRLLLERVAGVDINTEAVRLSAFGLYLALLNYQEPPDILEAGPLPPLIIRSQLESGVLAVADAFDPTTSEQAEAGKPWWPTNEPGVPWDVHSFDVVVGNPPWTEPGSDLTKADAWTRLMGRPVGDRSPSQQFLWRALSFLTKGGTAGLLVHANVVSNQRGTSKRFRAAFLQAVRIRQIVNFSDGRRMFFEEGIAPFLLVEFANEPPDQSLLPYRTLRRSAALKATGSVAFARLDRRLVRQADLLSKDYLWKTYAWGSHLDAGLLSRLETEARLKDLLDPEDPKPGYGYQYGRNEPTDLLRSLRSLNPSSMTFWGPLRDHWFESPPLGIKRNPDPRRYEGLRLLFQREARAGFGPNVRLDTERFSFRHRTYCVAVPSWPAWKAKVAFGIALSSLGRYAMFMRSGSWGSWYDQIVPDDILSLPVRLASERDPLTRRIVKSVDAIRRHKGTGILGDATSFHLDQELHGLLKGLDTDVLDLFELSETERELVAQLPYYLDLHQHGPLGFASRRVPSIAPSVGRAVDLADGEIKESLLGSYLSRFLEIWNPELGDGGELIWSVDRSTRAPLLLVIFSTTSRDRKGRQSTAAAADQSVLARVAKALNRPVLQGVYEAGVMRAVTDTDIIVAKRDEQRLWTRAAAVEDAEAAMLQAMNLRQRE